MNLTEKEKDYIKGYAEALQDLMFKTTGSNTCGKWYDPVDFKDDFILSYAFNLKDGGRRHPLSDYKNVKEITDIMLKESFSDIKSEIEIKYSKFTTMMWKH